MPTFALTGTSFFPSAQPPTTLPTSAGSTVQLSVGRNFITAGATMATLTANLPSSAFNGATVEIVSSVAVTALTVHTFGGGAVAGSPTSLTAGKRITMQYLGGNWLWVE